MNNLYTYQELPEGVSVLRPDGTSCAFMQGEEADAFLDRMRRAEAQTFPYGPFRTAAEMVSVLCDAYEPD